jgi:UDPglucose--hexose-1-phosphate uridylyltransferase
VGKGRLADGRAIFFYRDGINGPVTVDFEDHRALLERTIGSDLRRDARLDQWVTVAAHRQDRTHLPSDDDCPLCPSTEGRQTEIPVPSYDVVVFDNRFPSFSLPGRCEVISFTEDHAGRFASLTVDRVLTVLRTWAHRSGELAQLEAVEQVFCFENAGEEIGVTLHHPHGQIYAYPYLPATTQRLIRAAARHRAATGRSLFADLLANERTASTRIVCRSEHWIAFVPYAARWPLEVHLYPNRHVRTLTELTDEEARDFAITYLDLLRRVEAVFGPTTPYMAGWHQAPVRHRSDWHLHLELVSPRRARHKLKYLAASEAIMGAFVNDLVPEHVAARLRAA